MIRTSVYCGTSVDGFIARADHRLDFLDSAEPVDSDMGYDDFMASIDVMVMGRNTYDVVTAMIDNDGIEWPYGEKRVVILTSRALAIPPERAGTVEVASLEPSDLLDQLESRGFEHAYVDGGQTIQSFLRAGLIDEIIVTRVPVLIGAGISLFGDLPADIALRHVDTVVFENGCIQSRYRVLPSMLR